MTRSTRDRITIDLRGPGERLQALAAAQQMTSAALMRKALLAMLGDAPATGMAPGLGDGMRVAEQRLKVTLRLSALHVYVLTRRARAADVSQGDYVAGLIDGEAPRPVPPDLAQAIAALVRSTDQLAVMNADLNALMRLLRSAKLGEALQYRQRTMTLADDVRRHLAIASPLVAALRSTPRPARRQSTRHLSAR